MIFEEHRWVVLCIYQPTACEINAHSPYFNALTTCVRVRTPYVSSACKYCPVCCKHVVSTYLSLTTYATYDSRNHSHLNVACGRRNHTVSVTCVLSAHAMSQPSVQKNEAQNSMLQNVLYGCFIGN